MSRVSEMATAPSTPSEQRVRLVLEAEIFQDIEGGPDSLIVSTDELAAQPISPACLLGMVAEARAQLDAIARLAKVYEAEDTLRAIIAEHHLHVEEWDLANAAPEFRSKFVAFSAVTADGQRVVIVPSGQDPIERLSAVARLVRNMEAEA